MIGQLLAGHYRVLQVLGVGGFGQTYITEDLHLPGHPKCVLKHLKPASADQALLAIARKLFEKEAIVLQQLNGECDRIPRLLAYFEEQQEFYLVQEYVPGYPLSSELKNGAKWSEQLVIELLQEILEILVFIHGRGVIHRDIKPDNIMRRNYDRRLVLIDFGAIKQVRNQQMLTGQQTMTVAIGTPGYMPIEQASGNPRASSDLYALGTIGIQALTGVNPYDLPTDDRTGELKWEHLTVAHPQLIAMLQRMTRYHFKDRYHTAMEALQAIHRLIGGTFTPDSTYVQTTQPRTPAARTPAPRTPTRNDQLESQATVVVPRRTSTTVIGSAPAQTQPQRSFFPLIAGIISILAAVGSFVWFSGKLLNQRNFDADLHSDLCRIAKPTDLPATRVRSQPQRDAKIQVNLPRGTKIVYLGEQDAFVQIQMADRSTGWVYNNQITSCNLQFATPKPTPSQSLATPPPPRIERPQPIPVTSPKIDRKPIAVPMTPEPIPLDTPTPSPSPIEIEVPSPSPSPLPSSSPSPSPTASSIYPVRSRPDPPPSTAPTPATAPPPSTDPRPSPSAPDRSAPEQ